MADRISQVAGRSESAARVVATARQFQFVIDEPPSLGGEDPGPNPLEYLLAALIGWLNVVAHLTAWELGLELRNLEITATGPMNSARFFGDRTADCAGLRGIELMFRVDADEDAKTLEHWVEILKSRCPVSNNLIHPTPVTWRCELASQMLTS